MKSEERREKLISLLQSADEPVSGKELAQALGVSRQVIVQDITLLRATDHNIMSTSIGYILDDTKGASRVFKVIHSDEETAEELKLIVDYGGAVKDVFIYHKIYGTVKGTMNVSCRRDIEKFMDDLKNGRSSLLKNVTGGYHYHTVTAASEQILDLIQQKLSDRGFLAKLQDYEPVNFWRNEE